MGVWEVKPDDERPRWEFTPFDGVGPLRFGMDRHEVAAALAEPARASWDYPAGHRYAEVEFRELGVTAYFDRSRLACVALDARRGPQAELDGMPLVGQPPSRVERWLIEYTTIHGFDLRYQPEGDPGAPDLGLCMRAQRAGDVMLTRPLLMTAEWIRDPWTHVPAAEWRVG
ncbi:hypothetical protein [Catellatospora sp. NPDC049609]|uniref:hypothetical protein n=1 Tax=Catellatospora sp. NPDC049609 TaxID=3155505 RepID=UPI00344020A2